MQISRAQARPAAAVPEGSSRSSALLARALATALAGGMVAAGSLFLVGVALALLLPDRSLLGGIDAGKGPVQAGLSQMLNFVLARYGGGVGRVGPAVLVLLPLGACAAAARGLAPRTRGLVPRVRLMSGAAMGPVLGAAIVIAALVSGGLGHGPSPARPEVASAALLGCFWGALGGLAGAYRVLRVELDGPLLHELLPERAVLILRTARVVLVPLALSVAILGLAGAGAWVVQAARDPEIRGDRTVVAAAVDGAAFALDHGVRWTELGALSQFTGPAPIPISDQSKIRAEPDGTYRLLAFGAAMPSYSFLPMLIVLIGVPAGLALLAGFSLARLHRPRTLGRAAALGAITGPAWALALVLADSLLDAGAFGRASATGVLAALLLDGIFLGAAGGLLALGAVRRSVPGGGVAEAADTA